MLAFALSPIGRTRCRRFYSSFPIMPVAQLRKSGSWNKAPQANAVQVYERNLLLKKPGIATKSSGHRASEHSLESRDTVA